MAMAAGFSRLRLQVTLSLDNRLAVYPNAPQHFPQHRLCQLAKIQRCGAVNAARHADCAVKIVAPKSPSRAAPGLRRVPPGH